jgi:hypothetical protein
MDQPAEGWQRGEQHGFALICHSLFSYLGGAPKSIARREQLDGQTRTARWPDENSSMARREPQRLPRSGRNAGWEPQRIGVIAMACSTDGLQLTARREQTTSQVLERFAES